MREGERERRREGERDVRPPLPLPLPLSSRRLNITLHCSKTAGQSDLLCQQEHNTAHVHKYSGAAHRPRIRKFLQVENDPTARRPVHHAARAHLECTHDIHTHQHTERVLGGPCACANAPSADVPARSRASIRTVDQSRTDLKNLTWSEAQTRR